MRNLFHYRIRSHKDGVVSMHIKFPEASLDAFLAYFNVKKRQTPSMSPAEMRKAGEKYRAFVDSSVVGHFDKVLPGLDHRKAISVTLRGLKPKIPNLSHDIVRMILRRSGRLRGTRI